MTSGPRAMSEAVARRLLDLPDEVSVAISFLRPGNHIWRIDACGAGYYVKAHTKDWYVDVAAAAGAVRHEETAYRILAAAGLRTPVVVAAEVDHHNPLGWPYLITQALPGASLPDTISPPAGTVISDHDRDAVLGTAGRYLRRMHDLVFDRPGYLSKGTSPSLTDAAGWQHPIWRFERYLQTALRVWTEDAANVSPATMDSVMALLADTLPALRESFHPPRFTHGDCHAGGIFVDRDESPEGQGWMVTGVLDLEVASAANPAFDFNKLVIELVGRQRTDTYDWWTPLFDGYGREPEFDLTRLLLIGAAHENYTCLDRGWELDRVGIVDHVLRATTWSELLHLGPVQTPPCG